MVRWQVYFNENNDVRYGYIKKYVREADITQMELLLAGISR